MRTALFSLLILGLAGSCCSALEWQLTTYSGSDTHASWCGDEIVFHSDRNRGNEIWCMDEGGEALGIRAITQTPLWTDRCPTWSPACDSVYFESGYLVGARDIYRVSSAGPPDTPVSLTTDPADDMAPDASPDGIVFWSNRSGDDIYWMDSRGEEYGLERYTDAPEADSKPAWSPDGQYIAFGREGVGIFTVSVATREEQQVTFESADTSPAWSPDGSKLAFERLGPGDYDIWCTDNVPESTVSRASWGLIKATYRQGVDRLPN